MRCAAKFLLFLAFLSAIRLAYAQNANESVITSFDTVTSDVTLPEGDLMMDSKGNIYGTAYNYGTYIKGGIWELSPNGDGTWTHQVLYAFGAATNDGSRPVDSVVMDSKGNLYGVTGQGGANSYGTVFELSPPAAKGGAWTETILHNFADDGVDGNYPYSSVVMDAHGNLYGTTTQGGSARYGTVYELSPPSTPGGAWTETILHNFQAAQNDDGAGPEGRMVFDSAGNLYGTTTGGGTLDGSSQGTIYKLTAGAGNTFTYSILYTWGGSANDPGQLLGVPALDSDGNIYGTSYSGGADLQGTIWEISPPAKAGGSWTGQVLHSYLISGGDGYDSYGGVTIVDGNLYCTTTKGGANSAGAVIRLTPQSGGGWTESVFHSFGGTQDDGGVPYAGMIADSNGDLFGTTTYGGQYGGGEVFEILGKAASATALTATPSTVTVGENVTLKATVTGSGGTPSGTVTFSADGDALAHIALDGSGVASLTANSNGYAPGTYPILATYSGGPSFASSASSAVNVDLTRAPTQTTLAASPTSVTPPGSVTLTATVKRSASGAQGTPAGSVTFSAEGKALATVKLNGSGVAAVKAPSTGYPAGSYPIKATYSGDPFDASSASSTVTVTVK